MNSDDRNRIISNIDNLVESIDLDVIVPLVVNKRIFNQYMMDTIMRIEHKSDRIQCFLIDLTHRGPDAYDSFVEVLVGTGQMSAARILKPIAFDNSSDEEIIPEIVSHPSPNSMNHYGDGDTQGTIGAVGHTQGTIDSSEKLLRVEKARKKMCGERIYKISSNPRGFCLIINIEKFIHDCYDERHGSEAEANCLRDVFTELHFLVRIETNLMQSQIKETLEEYSKKIDLISHDAFVLIILSHGTNNMVVAADGIHLAFEDILKNFNNQNCPYLINKPRLCFFICCRGEKHDFGPKLKCDVDYKAVADSKKTVNLQNNKVTTAGDFLICYSTIDGFVSWRNEDSGSWVGTSLARALMKHACDTELHVIMTIVCEMVNNKITNEGAVQAMEYTYRDWKKLFYFNPGHTDNSGPPT